jgi:ATP-dependent helicase HrpA
MAWPALMDQGDAVGTRLFDTPDQARAAHAAGGLRLLEFQLPDKLAWLHRHSGLNRESQLAWAPRGQVAVLVDDLVRSSLAEAAGDTRNVRDASAFAACLEAVRAGIGAACRRQAERLNEILPACARIELALAREVRRRWPEAAAEVTEQLGALVYPGFLAALAPERLGHFPRYLAAIEERLRQLAEDPVRDRRRAATVEPFWHRYLAEVKAGQPSRAALESYRWQVEEFRVSVFAQRLGTAGKVSAQRLEAAWQGVLDARGG